MVARAPPRKSSAPRAGRFVDADARRLGRRTERAAAGGHGRLAARRKPRSVHESDQLLADVLTVLKVPLTLVPKVVTMVMHATRIKASITAYSTAVGPSSPARNRETRVATI